MGVWGSTPHGSTIQNLVVKLSSQDEAVIAEMWESGASLCQVWKDWKRLYLTPTESIESSIKLFLAHLHATGKSYRYIKEFGYVLKRFSLFINTEADLSRVTTKQWWCSVSAMGAGETARVKLKIYLTWCYKQGWLKDPVFLQREETKKVAGEISVLDNDQVASLIKSCPLDLLGHLWLCLCLGLRPAEATRTEALQVRDGFLVIGAKAAKTRTRRVLELPLGHEKYSTLIEPQVNLRRRMHALKQKAGLVEWPRNVMRHTAASHWLNKLQSADAASLHLGNSPVMLHRHYKALVTRKESEDFFKLWVDR